MSNKVIYSDKITYEDLSTIIGLFMMNNNITKMATMCEFKDGGFSFDVLAGE